MSELPRQEQGGASVLGLIHMFWHGAGLSRVEKLAMSSVLAHGHAVRLHDCVERGTCRPR